MTKQEAEAKRDWYQKRYDFEFVVEEFGPMHRMLAIRECERCGQKFKQGGGFDKPAICEDCDRKKRFAITKESWQHGERRREEYRRSIDSEEVCQ